MHHYTVAAIDVTDQTWTREYVEKVTPMVEAAGGRYLSRTFRIDKLEGDRRAPQLFLLIQWPSKEAAETFYGSAAYRPYRERRLNGSRSELFLVAGEDVSQTARIPGL